MKKKVIHDYSVEVEPTKEKYNECYYSTEIAQQINDIISEGKTLNDACKLLDIPRRTINNWLNRYPDFKKDYHQAQSDRCEVLAEQILEMVDEEPEYNKKGVDVGSVKNKQLRIAVRQYLMKFQSNRYRDNVEKPNENSKPTIIINSGSDKTNELLNKLINSKED
jgi:hypothetical protein